MINPSAILADWLMSVADARRPATTPPGRSETMDMPQAPQDTPAVPLPMPAPAPPIPSMPTLPHPAGSPEVPGTLVYRCRLCGAAFRAYPVRDSVGTLNAVVEAYNRLAPGGPEKLALAFAHPCPDGRVGIGDVVGMDDAAT